VKRLRILIADDEPPARRKLKAHLASEPDAEVAGEAADGLEAVEAIRELRPDLVFLDIQMPGLNGFEVIEAVGPEGMPPVVFVTAFDQYAIQAFEVRALDYLLKPYDEERFKKAYTWAVQAVRSPGRQAQELARLIEEIRRGPSFLQRLVVRKAGRLVLVPLTEVVRLCSRENYVEAFTPSGSHLIRGTLSNLESRLDPAKFARVHRRDIVALDAIRELQPWTHGDYVVVLKNGEKLRLSRRYQRNVMKD
jgi:two-component system LytT family response regulator